MFYFYRLEWTDYSLFDIGLSLIGLSYASKFGAEFLIKLEDGTEIS